MKNWIFLLATSLFCFFASHSLYAQVQVIPPKVETRIQIPTAVFAGEGILWEEDLKAMTLGWDENLQKEVELVFPEKGVQDEESTLVRKLEADWLSSSTLSSVGLSQLVPEFHAFSAPLLFRNQEELDYVLAELKPLLEEKLEKKGYVVLQWGTGGWSQIFSKTLLQSPELLKKEQFYIGSPEGGELYRELKWKTVPFHLGEVALALQEGKVTAYTLSPLSSMIYQWHTFAPNMVEINWSPTLVASLMKKEVWQSIPDVSRLKLKEAMERSAQKTQDKVVEYRKEVRVFFLSKGIKTIPLLPEIRAILEKEVAPLYKSIGKRSGNLFLEKVVSLLKNFRERPSTQEN